MLLMRGFLLSEPTNGGNLDRIMRISITLLCLVATFSLSKRFLIPPDPPPAEGKAGSLVGQVFQGNLKAQQGRTLIVLAVQPGCRFCTQSAEAFKYLQARAPSLKADITVLTPGDVIQAKQYMSTLGVEDFSIYQTQLDQVGISGTPTVLVVSDRGTVTQARAGALDTVHAKQILKNIDLHPSSNLLTHLKGN
jgi:hypothetical protein